MHFNHLGLPVRDYQRSMRFYTAYFGFDPATAQEYPDGHRVEVYWEPLVMGGS
jgi:catechol 2,3-dioxygenase-like lactoylglutathione lyase family enzyme